MGGAFPYLCTKIHMRTEIKTTRDGSATLYVPELNEHYHSIHGALQESMHVFIGQGLLASKQQEIRILEVGFGRNNFV